MQVYINIENILCYIGVYFFVKTFFVSYIALDYVCHKDMHDYNKHFREGSIARDHFQK